MTTFLPLNALRCTVRPRVASVLKSFTTRFRAGPAKVLVDFEKESKKLEIKAAQISGSALDVEAVKRLADLPGRDVPLAQALSAMQAVPASFVRAVNGIIAKLMYAMKAIEQKKETSA